MKKSALAGGLCAGVLAGALLLPVSASAAAADPTAPTGTELAGKTVFLDPGHQGGADGQSLTKQVDDGRGGTKDCQTTGMTSIEGVPEHTINWDVSQLVKSSLESLGAKVVTSRADDSGWGGCVDDRAKAASASGADVAISIHADSTSAVSDTVNHGFHLIIPTLPIPDVKANAAQSGPGLAASKIMRDAYVKAGFTPANYAGVVDGLQTRSDVAGPALTEVPDVFIEMGNGSNPADAAILDGQTGQLKHAIAITTGLINFLLGGDGTATTSPGAAAAASVPSTSVPSTSASSTSVPSDTSVPAGTSAPGDAAVPAATTPIVGDSTSSTDDAAAALTADPASTPSVSTTTATTASATTAARLVSALDSLSPYLQAFGISGLEKLVTVDNVTAASKFAQALLSELKLTG